MEKNKTAVEWLIEQLFGDNEIIGCSDELLQQAKKMEKEQQKDAWVDGNNTEICRRSIEVDECFNYYYTEVYGKE
jgi:hypothetical protein